MSGKIVMIGSMKGGVSKTVTTFNLAYSLSKLGKKVLAVDFDSQANLSTCLGVENVTAVPVTIGNLMLAQIEEEELPERSEYIQTRNGVDYISSSMVLSAVDAKLRLEMGSEKMLSDILETLRDSYDYILIDTSPSLGALTINAMSAADEVLITVNPQLLAMMGLQDFLKTVKKIKNRINSRLSVAGILLTMCDSRTNLCKVITEEVTETFEGQIKIFESMIPNTVKVYEEALIIAYGEGRNGKSTFWNTVSKVLGTYAGTISADTMTANCRRNVKPEIAELKGKRLAIAAELEEGMLLSTSVLKQVCSTDVVRGEKKFKDPFDYTPTHTVVLYTNHLPKVRATDEGTWRRLIVIPFHAKIEGKSDIKNYSDYLFENAGSYVLAWIIEGARKAIEADFHLERPKVVADAIAEYRGMNDWLEHFLEECCVRGDGLEEKSGELYQEYRSYCLRTGEISRNNADFTAVLEKAGYTRKKKKTGMWVQGLQLKDTDFAE